MLYVPIPKFSSGIHRVLRGIASRSRSHREYLYPRTRRTNSMKAISQAAAVQKPTNSIPELLSRSRNWISMKKSSACTSK